MAQPICTGRREHPGGSLCVGRAPRTSRLGHGLVYLSSSLHESYDEPESLRSTICLNCPMGADVRHACSKSFDVRQSAFSVGGLRAHYPVGNYMRNFTTGDWGFRGAALNLRVPRLQLNFIATRARATNCSVSLWVASPDDVLVDRLTRFGLPGFLEQNIILTIETP